MKFIRMLRVVLTLAAATPPAALADMPRQEISVQRSSGTSADVQVESRLPGRVEQTPSKKPSWITRVLRFVQQVLGGAIFIGG